MCTNPAKPPLSLVGPVLLKGSPPEPVALRVAEGAEAELCELGLHFGVCLLNRYTEKKLERDLTRHHREIHFYAQWRWLDW